MAPSSTPWSDDKLEELKRLWAEGYSATDIALELGAPFTRCSVLGKLGRMGLQRHKPRQALRPKEQKVRRRAVFIAPQAPPQPPQAPQPEEPALLPPKSRKLPLMQLEEHHCRWPTEGPPFKFCGARRRGSGPYCPYHMGKAFNKPRGPR